MCKECHVVSVDTELKDLQAVANACHRLGWQLRLDQKTYQWVGRWYDDTPVPRQLFDETEHGQAEYDNVVRMDPHQRTHVMQHRLGKCTHAIGLPNARGEIGLIQRGDKFVPIWDYYTQGLNDVKADNGMNGFLQAYAVELAKLTAQRQGQMFREIQCQDGSVELHVQIQE